MPSLKALLRGRNPYRGAVTTASKQLKELLEAEESDQQAILVAKTNLHDKLSTLSQKDKEIYNAYLSSPKQTLRMKRLTPL